MKSHQSQSTLQPKIRACSTAFTVLLIFLAIVIALSAGWNNALAQEPVEKKWKDQAELSLIRTDGNSEVATLQFKNKLTNIFTETLSSELKVEGLFSEVENETTAEKYMAEGRMDYKLGSEFSAALKAGWKRDRLSGTDNRYYLGPALVYRIITGPNHFLKTEAGVDYVYEEYTDETHEDFLSAGILAEYEWIITESVKFTETVKTFRDFNEEESYQIESITALITKLNTHFSFKTSYQINHNTNPTPEDKEKTDTILTVALVADF